MLPDMDGYEVLRRFRAAQIATPVLILSGLNEIANKQKGLGFERMIPYKAFYKNELAARVQAIIRRPKVMLPIVHTGRMVVNCKRIRLKLMDAPYD
jgi:two-component system cell cycle response regulator CtrA